MSSDGPTLNDDSYASAKAGPTHGHGHTHSHGGGPAHSHPLTAGQEAHARGRRSADHDHDHDHEGPRPETRGGHDFDLPALPDAVDVFDTTLRDGSQQEGLSLTVDDKLRVAEQLDTLGVTFIEGGWPGANPKDTEFFARAPKELTLARSTLVAFGSTRRAGVRAEDDDTLRHLVEAQTGAVCIVAKSSEVHVVDALRTTLDEAVAMVADSVAFLVANDLRVFLDAEHFFDGYKANPEFTLRILQAAEEAGAETLVLCDTNGGILPYEVERIVGTVLERFETQVGVHFHNDSGCAVANSLAGVSVGATHVQGCLNGYGERAGNADLAAVVPDLSLKLQVSTIPPDRLPLLTPVSHHIAELVNIAPHPQQPFVGASVFAHKAGLHTSAIARRSDAYEHVVPDLVGNGSRFVVSEMAGRSTLVMKAEELGLELDSDAMTSVLESLKRLEYEGYHFAVADGSLELLLRDSTGWRQPFFELESYRVIADQGEHLSTEATVKLRVDGERVVATAEGNGPVNALDGALRAAIGGSYPSLEGVHLVDYRVRVLDSAKGTGSVTRVLIDSTDGDRTWTTIGVSENIIAASWQALSDSVVYGLLHAAPAGA
ncbi:MAG TPA: citramalate synthase [Acidimicrobiales bacterium]